MKNYEKQIAKSQLKSEERTLKELEQIYRQAKRDVETRIAELNAREDLQNIESIVYQKKYQQAILKQLNETISNLHFEQYKTVEQFLQESYEDGYIGAMYSLNKQGIPLTVPIDDRKVARALQTDSKLSERYYQEDPIRGRLEENVELLKTRVRTNLSRGIAQGQSWLDVAKNIATGMNNPFDIAYRDSVRIVRTEGHRINQQGYLDAGDVAKDKGADILKQWDATLDSVTRPWHMEADGQIREWDEDFLVMGENLKAPSIGGSARNVINCRCQLLQRARWALDDAELETLKQRAEFFGLDKTESFEEYKSKFLKLPENADTMKVPTDKQFHDVRSTTTKIQNTIKNPEDYEEFLQVVGKSDIAYLYDYADNLKYYKYGKQKGLFYGSGIEWGFGNECYYKDEPIMKWHTLCHEYGHYTDTFTRNKDIDGITFSEYIGFRKATGKSNMTRFDASLSDQFISAVRKDLESIRNGVSTGNKGIGVQDAWDGYGFGRIGWGHGDRYYNDIYNHEVKGGSWGHDYSKETKEYFKSLGLDASNQAKVKLIVREYTANSELWANIASAEVVGGSEYESMKSYFPNAIEAFEEISRKMVQ